MAPNVFYNERGKMIKRIGIILMLMVNLLWAAAPDSLYRFDLNREGSDYRGELERVFSASPGGRFVLRGISGDVSVTGTNDNELKVIERFLIRRVGRVDAQRFLEKYRLRPEKRSDILEFRGRYGGGRRVRISYEIYLPRIFSLLVESSEGDIILNNILGDVKVYTGGGDVEVAQISGKAELETAGGDISLKESEGTFNLITSGGDVEIEQFGGTIYLKTSGGDIDAFNLSGAGDLNTSGGDIVVEQVQGKTFSLETSGGFIKIANVMANLRLTTSAGDIEAEDVIGDITANTSAGDIDLNRINGNVDLHTSAGDVKAYHVLGYLEATTSSGDITSSKCLSDDFTDHHVYLKTTRGDILLYLSESINATVDARIYTSWNSFEDYDISSEFPLTIRKNYDSRDEISGFGEINGGGNLIKLRASEGNIIIKILKEE